MPKKKKAIFNTLIAREVDRAARIKAEPDGDAESARDKMSGSLQ